MRDGACATVRVIARVIHREREREGEYEQQRERESERARERESTPPHTAITDASRSRGVCKYVNR